MARVSDEERREVARRLRDYTVKDLRYSDPICELVCSSEIDCIGFDACCGSDTMPECVKLVFDRLADLIEPSIPADPGETGLASVEGFIGEMRHSTKEEQDAYNEMLKKVSVELHPVDRDALLRLAKNLDAQAECRIKSNDIITRRGDRSRNMAIAKDLSGIACEIRNALGVES